MKKLLLCFVFLTSINANADSDGCSIAYLVKYTIPAIPNKFKNKEEADIVYKELEQYIKEADKYIKCGDEKEFIVRLKINIKIAKSQYYRAMTQD